MASAKITIGLTNMCPRKPDKRLLGDLDVDLKLIKN